jgi:prepilin-type N-terminal cleavage/methylation domain-containing protein
MRHDDKAGFTLTEMSVVIAVFSIVAASAVIGTTHLVRSNRLVGATNTLVGDLHYARALATSQRKTFQVLFESDGYTVVRVAPADTILRRTCPPGVTCSVSDSVTFFAWGLTNPSTITLATVDGSKAVALAANGNVTRP